MTGVHIDDLPGYRRLARALLGQVVEDLRNPVECTEAAAWLFDDDDFEIITWRRDVCDLADVNLERTRKAALAADTHQLTIMARMLYNTEEK